MSDIIWDQKLNLFLFSKIVSNSMFYWSPILAIRQYNKGKVLKQRKAVLVLLFVCIIYTINLCKLYKYCSKINTAFLCYTIFPLLYCLLAKTELESVFVSRINTFIQLILLQSIINAS